MRTGLQTILAKTTVVSLLAFSFGTATAWADETNTQSALTADAAVTASMTDIGEDAPSLRPGDFFYFVKTMYERIQLAFANDDMEEAILLAQFAQERLAESAALLEEGKTQIAEVALQRSLAEQQLAVETAASVVGAEPAVPAVPAGQETQAVVAALAGAETGDSPADADETETSTEEAESVEPAVADKVKHSLQHNIMALTAALEHVNNPKAQQSLLKNITKSFAKLEKKLTRLSGKSAASTTSETDDAEAALSANDTAAEANEVEAPTAVQAASAVVKGTVSATIAAEAVDAQPKEKEKKEKTKKTLERKRSDEKQSNKAVKSQGNHGKGDTAGQLNKKETK
ncbi:DUF5667 domain-containing protein [Paenibacillus methanolicus]|uniref:DUF5667 domain-containing protein n=1 Tax=Paenibacillus methanolicus TaxID=582686 RepID=A0A5S5CJQ4_9BACL|nr:DUF5667 domain-containing protein [Paenibacillus methanolicus]TYP79243.1 hypothetical protein BCM02_101361 [Paenibacillus methanolicus]